MGRYLDNYVGELSHADMYLLDSLPTEISKGYILAAGAQWGMGNTAKRYGSKSWWEGFFDLPSVDFTSTRGFYSSIEQLAGSELFSGIDPLKLRTLASDLIRETNQYISENRHTKPAKVDLLYRDYSWTVQLDDGAAGLYRPRLHEKKFHDEWWLHESRKTLKKMDRHNPGRMLTQGLFLMNLYSRAVLGT